VKRKIPSPRRKSNPRTQIVQPVAYSQRVKMCMYMVNNTHHVVWCMNITMYGSWKITTALNIMKTGKKGDRFKGLFPNEM